MTLLKLLSLLFITGKLSYCKEILPGMTHFNFFMDSALPSPPRSSNEEFSKIQTEVKRAQEALERIWTAPSESRLGEDQLLQVSDECDEAIQDIADSSDMVFKVTPILDAAGKPGAAILEGNNIMDGSYSQCFSVNYTGFCITGFILVALPTMPWRAELCVPKECSSTDVTVLINNTGVILTDEDNVHCTATEMPDYSWGAVVMIVIAAIFVGMVASATLADVVFEQFIPFFFGPLGKDEKKSVITSSNNPDISDSIDKKESIKFTDEKFDASQEKIPLIIHRKSEGNKRVQFWDFVKAFSLFKTVPTLLATDQAPGVITSLNGIRVISMFWVIVGHTHLWVFMPTGAGVDNPASFVQVSSRFTFQPVNNGYVGVDSFFLISGVLVAYLTLKQMKTKGKFPFLHYYIHRYLRLTPTYAFILFFSWALAPYIAVSPVNVIFGPEFFSSCKKYWWSNLLYLNNFFPWKLDDECFGHAWYLANDMQFYVITPLILIPAFYAFKAAVIVVAGLLFCSLTVTAILAGVFDLQMSRFAGIAYKYNGTATGDDYNALVYVKPWSRIPPYLVGLMLGYILHKGYKLPFSMRKNAVLSFCLFFLAGVVGISQLYGLYFTWHGHIPTRFENILYITTNFFLWGMVVATVIFLCHSGYGWIINSFLSMKMWTPLSRMTFNAYLIHPVLLTVVYGQLQQAIHYTDITMAFYVVGIVVLSYGVAGVVCICVEFPLGTIEMLVFQLAGMKGRASQRVNQSHQVLPMGDHKDKRNKQEQTQV